AGSVVAHRARFFSRGPRDVRDGRWSEGRRARGMVAVDVAIAHRGPRDVAGWSVVGGLAGYVAPILGTDATAQRSRCGTAAMAHAAGEAQYAAHASMSLRASTARDSPRPSRWSEWSESDSVSGCGRWSMVDGRERLDRVRWANSAEREIARPQYRVLGRS